MHSAFQRGCSSFTASSRDSKLIVPALASGTTSTCQVKLSPGPRRSWCFRPSGMHMTRLAYPVPPSRAKRKPSTVFAGGRLPGDASSRTAPRMPSSAAKSAATSSSTMASTLLAPGLVTVIFSRSPASTKRRRVTLTLSPASSNDAQTSAASTPTGRGSTPSISRRSCDSRRVSPDHSPSPENSPGRIEPSRADTAKKRSRLSITRSEMSCPDEICVVGSLGWRGLVRTTQSRNYRRRIEYRPASERVVRPLAARQQVDSHRLEVAHALVGADRFADPEDAHRGMPLLDHVAQHVEVRVVGHSRLADAADGGPDWRPGGVARLPPSAVEPVTRGPVARLPLPEVDLVAWAPAAGALLADELDPLGVLRPLAGVDDEPHRPALVQEARVHARVALALSGQPFMPADQQRRFRVELDVVDRREQRDDGEGVGDEVGDDADVGRRAGQRLLLQDLDPDLLHALQEVAERALLGQQHAEQPDLELEVIVVGGHDLDAARRCVEEPAVLVRRRPKGFLDQHDVAQLVVALERGKVRCGRGRDVRDDVRARLQLALELVARG